MKRAAATPESETGQPAEQRREPRRAAGDEVLFLFGASLPDTHDGTVRATLLDRSANGFRAQHDCAQLTCGQLVKFRLAKSKGLARVVWTRILGDRVESGFLILRSPDLYVS